MKKSLERNIEMEPTKFGVQFRNFPREYDGKILDHMIEVAIKCEDLGFDSIWMIDHLEMCPPISYESQPIPECWSTLSALASATHKITIGSLVSCSLFRNPSYLSAICNTLSKISHDRLIVGIGSGWFDQEFHAYGIHYPSPGERVAATRNTLEILRKRIARPSYPIWIGGSGEGATLKLVAKAADGCSLFGDPDTVKRKLKILESYCALIGRGFAEMTKSKHSNVVIGTTTSEVSSKLSKIIPDKSKWNNFFLNNIVGTPTRCLEQAEKYVASGANYLTLTFPDLFETNCLDIFSNEVIEQIH
jgi:alkanesulfonate monooxygenase SsuD/methylene tetrahydromethanopterin reductase-like flavin-dependent oxidoreductase (luciferase family)